MLRRAAAVLAGLLAVSAHARAAGDCPALPARSPMPAEAQPGMQSLPFWRSSVAGLNARLAGVNLASRRLVFLGDSITASWDPALFSRYYGTRAPLLLGIGGDATQGVLARLPEEWGALRPRLVVLLIGTNNLAYGTPENIALGTAEIVRWIHGHSSGTRILILGILPRGAAATDPARMELAHVNQLVAQCADDQTTFFLDPGALLLDPGGSLTTEISFDSLHLTPAGYAILATAMEPLVKRIMGE